MVKAGGVEMKVLFLTVGTGVGQDDAKIKSLAHGLLVSILKHAPDKIIFFGSEKSKRTIEAIKELYLEEENKELEEERYEFVEISNVDDFNSCYTPIEEKIKEYKDHKIVIDYTSGTKTMTTSAAIAAMLYQIDLFVTIGKRGENGLVKPGTEDIRSQNLFVVYDKFSIDRAKDAFNSFRFEDARNYLKQVVDAEEKDHLLQIVDAYDEWDKFNHDKAWELLSKVKIDNGGIAKNKSFLGKMNSTKKSGGFVEEFLIPDLLNNAERRIEEGKYDDAVARLYRCLEMIMQYTLKKDYGIDSSDVDTWRLKVDLGVDEKIVEELERKRIDDKIKIGLMEDINLLDILKSDLGQLKNDNELKELIRKRNFSILAHGNEPVDKATAEKFLKKVLDVGRKVVRNIDKKREDAKFPKL
ncbi:MAG: TIGR02710 family CRISPR-associated protein [Aquificota bacterium]|nr:MAG: TIGR02710 family CRISPR-associated protein [Aquificota bacterium]